MNREQRRQAERIARRGARSTPQRESERNITHSLVAQALVRNRIMREVHSLRTNASLHAFTGNDATHIADRMGRLLYTVAFAATAHAPTRRPRPTYCAAPPMRCQTLQPALQRWKPSAPPSWQDSAP